MDGGEYRLYWKDRLVGIVTDVGWTDFPWVGGNITIGKLSEDMLAMLAYVDRESKTDEGVRDWPFADELGEHWLVIKPGGESVEISPPLIDFSEGFVIWR